MGFASHRGAAAVLLFCLALSVTAEAGMPSPLPSSWRADGPEPVGTLNGFPDAVLARWQAISFFLVCLLGCAWGLKGLWNAVRRDVAWLPAVGYGRALGLVLLWGLASVVVLTMISGARELMTPGAWEKQGWTYALAEPPRPRRIEERRQALIELRQALWQYAATHAGRFPDAADSTIPPERWELPDGSGLRFLYQPGRSAGKAGQLLAFEPEIDGPERLVLLTNGLIGTMSTAEIDRAVQESGTP